MSAQLYLELFSVGMAAGAFGTGWCLAGLLDGTRPRRHWYVALTAGYALAGMFSLHEVLARIITP